MSNSKKKRLAILASHPIEYQGPFFKKIASNSEIDLVVYYCWDFGVGVEQWDPGFGKKIKWDIPLLDGYTFKFLKNISWRKASSHFFGEINPSVCVEVFKNNYDAILVIGWSSFSAWLLILAAIIKRTPFFLRGENPLSQEFKKNMFKRYLKVIILRFLFLFASSLLYIGEENRKFYKYYGVPDKKLFFVPYAVDNERFISEARELISKKDSLKESIGISKEKVVILFAGKFIYKKRPMDLLRAYKNTPLENKALVFVGDGELHNEMREYVRKNELKDVYFVGFQNQLEIGKYYAMADIFVLPSGVGETWGLVVNEAMCFGLPIIVSDVVGCGADLVHNGENGYIFPLGDVEELCQRLSSLVTNEKVRNQFGKSSRDIISKYSFTEDIIGLNNAINPTAVGGKIYS